MKKEEELKRIRKYIIKDYVIIGEVTEEFARRISEFLDNLGIRTINYKVIVGEDRRLSLRIKLAENEILNLTRVELKELEEIYLGSERLDSKLPLEFHNIPAHKSIIEKINSLNNKNNIEIDVFKNLIYFRIYNTRNSLRLKIDRNIPEDLILKIVDEIDRNFELINLRKNCNIIVNKYMSNILLYIILKCKYEIRNDEAIKRIYELGYEIKDNEIVVSNLVRIEENGVTFGGKPISRGELYKLLQKLSDSNLLI